MLQHTELLGQIHESELFGSILESDSTELAEKVLDAKFIVQQCERLRALVVLVHVSIFIRNV